MIKKKHNEILSIRFLLGLSLVFVSDYYFSNFLKMANPENYYIFINSIIILIFKFIFFYFFFNFFFFKINSTIGVKIYNFALNILLIYLVLLLVKIYYRLFNVDFDNFFRNILDQYYFSPNILLSLLLSPILFLKKTTKIKIYQFISLLGLLLFILVLYINFINKNLSKKNFQKSFFPENYKIVNSEKKKVVWIIFDQYDPFIADKLKEEIKLDNYSWFKQNSYFNDNTYPAGENTMLSMPKILMNINENIQNMYSKNSTLLLKTKHGEYPFVYDTTIFSFLNKKQISSSILSSTIEYCSVYLKNHNFKICKDRLRSIKKKTHRYFLDGLTYTLKLNYLIDRFFFNFFSNKKISKIKQNFYSSENNTFNLKYLFSNYGFYRELNKLTLDKNYKYFDDNKFFEIQDFLKAYKNSNLTFLHLQMPHLPANYAKNLYNIKTIDIYEDYLVNLKFSDNVMGKVFKNIEILNKKEMQK